MKKKIDQSKPADLLLLLDQNEQKELFVLLEIEEEGQLGAFPVTEILLHIIQLRSPFIKMMHDINIVLAGMEATIRGNIQFIVLPSGKGKLELEFSSQLRKYTITALNEKKLSTKHKDVLELINTCDLELSRLYQRITPTLLREDSQAGRMLRQRSKLSGRDPWQSRMDEMMADNMSRTTLYHHPFDFKRLKEIEDKISGLKLILKGPSENSSGTPDELQIKISHITKKLKAKLATVAGRLKLGSTYGVRSRPDTDFMAGNRNLNQLRELLASLSFQQESIGELFDYMQLDIWKQRWRIYEIWLLCSVIIFGRRLGAKLLPLDRVKEGKWQLKFTRDKLPAVSLEFEGIPVHLYYQLFETGKENNNMPDIAVKSPDYGNILVLDPKHGQTYGFTELKEVCIRYAKGFSPALSCVASYFPPKERATAEVEFVGNDLIIFNVQPGSKSFALLEKKVREKLMANLPRSAFLLKTLLILFDVSSSTARVNAAMQNDLNALLKMIPLTEASVIIPFSDGVCEPIPATQGFNNAQLSHAIFGGGTDTNAALRNAIQRAADEQQTYQLWLFTDGSDTIDQSLLNQAPKNISFVFLDYHSPGEGSRLAEMGELDNLIWRSKTNGGSLEKFLSPTS